MAQHWDIAIGLAAVGLLVGVAIHYAIGALLLVGALFEGSPTVATYAKLPGVMWLASHGAIEGSGLWLTGILWLALAFAAAGRVFGDAMRARFHGPTVGIEATGLAVKVAVPYAVVIIIATFFFPGVNENLRLSMLAAGGISPGPSFGALDGPNAAAGLFFTLVIVATLTVWQVRRQTGTTYATMLGVDWRPPRAHVVRAGWSTARWAVKVSFISLLVFFFIGSVLEQASNIAAAGAASLGRVVVSGISVTVLWAGADIAGLFAIDTLRFFTGNTWITAGARPAWMLLGLLILLIMMVLAGRRAVLTSAPTSGSDVLLACGVTLASIMAIAAGFSIFHIGDEGGEIFAVALFLPVVWGITLFGSGLMTASTNESLPNIRFAVASAPAFAPPPTGSPMSAPPPPTTPTTSATPPSHAPPPLPPAPPASPAPPPVATPPPAPTPPTPPASPASASTPSPAMPATAPTPPAAPASDDEPEPAPPNEPEQSTHRQQSSDAGSVASQLARLAELHRNGTLDDEEYKAAKRRLLAPPSS